MTAQMVPPVARGKKSKQPIQYSHEDITPKRAAVLLSANTANRRVRRTVVDRYVSDMIAGRWIFNGQPILVSDTGVLLDGQHRLMAVIESGMTIPMVVIYGLMEETRDSVDIGAPRAAGDVLTFHGVPNGHSIAAVTRIVMHRHRGAAHLGSFKPSNVEIRDYVEAHPMLVEAAEVYGRSRKHVSASPAVVAAAWFLCAEVDREAADAFFITRLIETEGLTASDPVKALRSKLLSIVGRDTHAVKSDQLRYIIHAWNLDRERRRVTKLQAPRGGWNRTNFPDPK